MKDLFALIGLLFVVFLTLGLGCGLLGSDKERKRYAFGMVEGICSIVGFGLASWLISVIFVGTLSGLYTTFCY